VEAISVEGGDTLNRQSGAMTASPHIVGYQAAGEIIEVGSRVTHLRVGQKVATSGANGSHAELRSISARGCWVVPDGLNTRLASVIPVTFGTAYECLFEAGKLEKGQSVLIQAGASGLGVAAIQLAKRAGATVIATASSDEKLAALKPLGLDSGINYKKENVVDAVKRLTNDQGVNLVVDTVGGAALQASILSLAYRGRVSMVGRASRDGMTVDVSNLMVGNRSLTGVFLGAEQSTSRVYENIQRLMNDVAKGELKVVVDKTFPLSEAAAAHAYIESRAAVGRVLLIP
jgi:NADPH2:quinone reductase